MSYSSWERKNFYRPLYARAWSSVCASGRAIRRRWRAFFRAWLACYDITI